MLVSLAAHMHMYRWKEFIVIVTMRRLLLRSSLFDSLSSHLLLSLLPLCFSPSSSLSSSTLFTSSPLAQLVTWYKTLSAVKSGTRLSVPSEYLKSTRISKSYTCTYVHAITNNYSLSNSTSVYSLLLHISLHLINFKTTLCTQEDSTLVQYCRTFLP